MLGTRLSTVIFIDRIVLMPAWTMPHEMDSRNSDLTLAGFNCWISSFLVRFPSVEH